MLSLVQHGPTFELEDYLAQIAFIPDEKAAVSGKLLRFQPPDSCLSGANARTTWNEPTGLSDQLLFGDCPSACMFFSLP